MKAVLFVLTASFFTASSFAQYNPFEELSKCYQEKAEIQIQLNQCRNDADDRHRTPHSWQCVLDASGLGDTYLGSGATRAAAEADAKQQCNEDTLSSNCAVLIHFVVILFSKISDTL